MWSNNTVGTKTLLDKPEIINKCPRQAEGSI